MIDLKQQRELAQKWADKGYVKIGVCPKAIVEMLDMIEAEKLDTARIDWLVGQDNCVIAEGLNGFWLSWIDEHDQRRTKYQDGSYPSARAAIDAAMAATKGEQA